METKQSGAVSVAYAAAVVGSAVTALLYLLVGFEVVKVDGVAEVGPGPAIPLVIAAGAFIVLTALLAFWPGQVVYLVGVVLALAVIAGYLVVAPSRNPSFEPWGLTVKAVEAVVAGALIVVLVRSPTASQLPGHRSAGRPRPIPH